MQQIIVIFIGIVVVGIIVWRLSALFKKGGAKQNPCAGCNADCALRDLKPEDCDKEADLE